jgi:hypothetical protein
MTKSALIAKLAKHYPEQPRVLSFDLAGEPFRYTLRNSTHGDQELCCEHPKEVVNPFGI